MPIDLTTAVAMSGFISLVCGVSFLLNTALRRNDAPGRAWSVAFIAAILVSFSNMIWVLLPDTWWPVSASNAATVVAVGSLWVGARYFNRRPPRYWIVLSIAAVAAIAVPLMGAARHGWSGGEFVLGGVILFAILGAVECLRGLMQRNMNARILAGVLMAVAVFYTLRLTLLEVFGPESYEFTTYTGTVTALFINTLMIVIGSISLSILQVERMGVAAVGDQSIGIYTLSGALNYSAFQQQMNDWIERADLQGEDLTAIAVDIDNLPDINTVMGRSFGDEVITTVGNYLRRCAPANSLIGHPGSGRLVILSLAGDPEDAINIARTLQNVLVDEPMGSDEDPLRITASFAIATTVTTGMDGAALLKTLDEDIDRARRAGGNVIVASGELVA